MGMGTTRCFIFLVWLLGAGGDGLSGASSQLLFSDPEENGTTALYSVPLWLYPDLYCCLQILGLEPYMQHDGRITADRCIGCLPH